jgi:hypothetical protein
MFGRLVVLSGRHWFEKKICMAAEGAPREDFKDFVAAIRSLEELGYIKMIRHQKPKTDLNWTFQLLKNYEAEDNIFSFEKAIMDRLFNRNYAQLSKDEYGKTLATISPRNFSDKLFDELPKLRCYPYDETVMTYFFEVELFFKNTTKHLLWLRSEELFGLGINLTSHDYAEKPIKEYDKIASYAFVPGEIYSHFAKGLPEVARPGEEVRTTLTFSFEHMSDYYMDAERIVGNLQHYFTNPINLVLSLDLYAKKFLKERLVDRISVNFTSFPRRV